MGKTITLARRRACASPWHCCHRVERPLCWVGAPLACFHAPPSTLALHGLLVMMPGAVQRYGLQSYPTLKVFGKNKRAPDDYQGGRDLDSLQEAAEQLHSASRPPPEASAWLWCIPWPRPSLVCDYSAEAGLPAAQSLIKHGTAPHQPQQTLHTQSAACTGSCLGGDNSSSSNSLS